MFRWEADGDGIVTLTMDDPTASANTMSAKWGEDFAATLDRLEAEKDSITGVVLTSAKKTFFAGGNLDDLVKYTKADAQKVFDQSQSIKGLLRRLETLGKPVVSAINGAALGGGLEIALATHHRIALDAKGSKIGLPEVTLGLLPGGGGVVRVVRLLGLADGLMNVLLQGQQRNPKAALEAGLVHEVVDTPEEMISRAKQWVKDNPEAIQPWDQKKYKIPGGTPSTPSFAANLPAFPSNLRKQLKNAPMPAPYNIMSAAVEGSQVDIDNAGQIESRYFADLACGQVSTNMTRAFFFDLQAINKGASRPDGYEKHSARKVVVLGAGMMGAGIAYSCAMSGLEVVLKDVSQENADKGKAYSQKILDKAVSRGKQTQEKADEVLARITPTADAADASGADLVIEAVFESPDLKKQVFAEVMPYLAPDAVLGSNTSTLPITDLATGVDRPEDFIGLHFFSPVDKMPLLEIIRGERTSDATLAKAVDIALQIKKTPIVVSDSRGFFTSRVIGTFINEAVAMLGEGAAPSSIEQAGSQAGYPAPPLQLMDELTLTLPQHIRQETRKGVEAAGGTWVAHPSEAIIDRMVELGRKGRSSGAGFYEYDESGKRTRLWPGLSDEFGAATGDLPFEDMQERMLFAEALETVKCFDEGVLHTIADANIGSIMGIGYPAWTGGVAQYIDGYPGGLPGFVERARILAKAYGDRFAPPASVVEKAEKGQTLRGE
ncbi:3-hydroxyacyl-CoA dehydrogenase NAD-binding domain-containing protein [Actinomycetospora callitridis]|uniref:3-hydroxyacyl-CoA dehydrogenase NAD-binding domain-containing protein n=1 Tax=Actinomycetospora callitridis TaxID=913944 RepID=UPI0023653DC3|nr:3-hydroxyacyl-CoA dehydrogenase NAD-binding domain-containing protein [Actinomycetospora callitridis]MDD7918009.1 3-hydroxyacyl-CoA dehydrogenase NAD-binding domain-containing protein [Actinomycetospora callitridis]